jgi:hypothetical protein
MIIFGFQKPLPSKMIDISSCRVSIWGEHKEMMMEKINLPELGRRMMTAATFVPVGDDVRFNTLCRVGEELTTLGAPFCKRSLREFEAADVQFIRNFVRELNVKVVG